MNHPNDYAAVHWTLKQDNKTAQPKAHKYSVSHFSLFKCCLSVVL